jgi:hypothetical protein
MNRLSRWSLLTQRFTIWNQPNLAQSMNGQSIRGFSVQQEDFGAYNVILPPEPFAFGIDHIQPRVVPDHIVKPLYARATSSSLSSPSTGVEHPLQNNGKIILGGEAEFKIRAAALLAKKVREFAGTQVKVRVVTFEKLQEC